MENMRKPVVAGRFYAADASGLGADIKDLLAEAEGKHTPCAGQVPLGLVLPHAGYIFSGGVTGQTLGQIKLPDTVIILAPNHTGKGAELAVWPDGTWLTPFDEVKVDDKLAAELINNSKVGFVADTEAHIGDHSIEVLLPFLQALNQYVHILPISVSVYESERLQEAGLELATLIKNATKRGEQISIIVSTDLSHYLNHDEAIRQDSMIMEQFAAIDPEGLYGTVMEHSISMCGVAPATMMLHALLELGCTQCCVTAQTTSAVTGASVGASYDRVVGYGGAIFV